MKKFLGAIGTVLFVAVVVLPVVWIFLTSVKSNQDILNSPWAFTVPPRWENFGRAWVAQDLGLAFWLSLMVVAGTLIVLIPLSSLMAHALARHRFRGRGAIFALVAGGMIFPNLLAAVPLFLIMARAGLDDSVPGLILAYVAYSLPFTVFVLHGFYSALPRELEEAAVIDGAGPWQLFIKIMEPLARPGLWVVVIFNCIGLWNEYNLAKLLLLRSKTLPVGLADLISQQQYAGDWGALFAGTTLVMLPVLAVYLALKDRVQQAMLAGAIK